MAAVIYERFHFDALIWIRLLEPMKAGLVLYNAFKGGWGGAGWQGLPER